MLTESITKCLKDIDGGQEGKKRDWRRGSVDNKYENLDGSETL